MASPANKLLLQDSNLYSSGYDATACATAWLGARPVPTDLTCP